MRPIIIFLLPLAFSLLVSASPPPPPAITLTPTAMIATKTPAPVLTKPAPERKARYVYWLPWVSTSGTTFAIGAPPLPVCERDYQPACTTPTLAIPPTEPPTTAYP